MRQLLSFTVLFFLSGSALLAQLSVSGKISDKESAAPLEAVNILFKNLKSGAENGTTSGTGGLFTFTVSEPGTYLIRYSYLGYKTKKDTLLIDKPLDLGSVKMKPDKQSLGEIRIEDEKDVFDEGSDRLTYSPDDIQLQSGASATEFLQTIPSLNVNAKGKITLRGNSKVTIMIDGKLAGVSSSNVQAILENLPVSSIERVEVYDNPTAKMNAQGSGGVINIVTKKGQNEGFTGSVSLAVGIREKANGSVYLSYRKKKVGFYANYGYRYGKFAEMSRDSGLNRQSGLEWNYKRQFQGRQIEGAHSGGFGLDYNPNVFNSLIFSGFSSYVYGLRGTNGEFQQFFDNQPAFDSFRRTVYQRETEFNAEGALLWTKKFRKPKQTLETELTYGYNNQRQLSDLSRIRGEDVNDRTTDRIQNYHFTSFRSDFTLPISKGMKFETGIRYTGRFIRNEFDARFLEDQYGFWLRDTTLINTFRYTEHVAGFYGEFTHKIKKWKYRIGMRAEPTFIRTELETGNFSANKFYFGWFPFAGIYRDLNKYTEMKLTFARRISRPKPGSLNPFTDFSDPLDLRFGNPDLNPEYLNTLELSTQYKKEDYLFRAALFGRFYNNPYGRVRFLDTGSVVVTTTLNYKSETQGGLELIGSAKLFKVLTLSGNVNLYYTHIDASNIIPGQRNAVFGYEAKLTASWFLPKYVSGVFLFNYRGPEALVQGKTFDTWRMDLSIRRSFLKNKLTLTFSVRDIFNTWYGLRETRTADIDRNSVSKDETRIIMAGIIFRFGKSKSADTNGFPENDPKEREEE